MSIVVTRCIPDAGRALLAPLANVVTWEREDVVSRAWLCEHLEAAEGLLCLPTDPIDTAVLDCAPRLKVVSTMAVGYDNIEIAECTRRGIPVGHTPGVLTETTADFAFALLMAAARRLPEASDYVRQGAWNTWHPNLLLGRDLHGAVLGIIGYGRIGRAVAARARGFEMHVLAVSSSSGRSVDTRGGEVDFVDLQTALARADFVTLHVPLTAHTRHLIGRAELQTMKPTAMLVNTARGPVVDSAALYEALSQRRIAGAALDVTDPEPIASNDPLLTLPNCLIVPHIASASEATRGKMSMMAVENLLAGLRGKRLPHCVNPGVYQQQ